MRTTQRRSSGPGLRAAIAAVSLAGALLAVPAVAGAQLPSLRLFGVAQRLTVSQAELRAGSVDLGVWATPVGGPFQINLQRPNYGPWEAAQVDAGSGLPLRQVPMRLVDLSGGLARFLSIELIDSRGHTAARHLFTFCPNGESARVDDTGPQIGTYPFDCSSVLGFPFARGVVWGIDQGWAVAPSLSGFSAVTFFGPGPPPAPPAFFQGVGRGLIDVKPGRYTAIVSITAPYRELFAIPTSQASVTLKIRVTHSVPPRKRRPIAVSTPAVHLASDPPLGVPPGALVPNLVALPAWQIAVQRAAHRDLLTFNSTIWDAGPAQFMIEGFRRPHSNLMDAYEYFFDPAGNVVGRAPAGTMFYDNDRGHHHWHLKQLASYTLVGPSGRTVLSQKQSFCIAPVNAVDLTVPHAQRGGNVFLGLGFGGSTCDLYSPDAIWISEQLPVGWGDTYSQSVAGQAFDITNLPNGGYRIEVRVNPLGVLTETTTADDLAVRYIRIWGRRGARRVSVSPWHGIQG